jgi:hypothetical protein
MAAVDPGLADWLRGRALFTSAADAAITAAWGSDAIEGELVSPFALKADADTEAARQIAFWAGPLVLDTHVVPGLRADLQGRVVTIATDKLGYGAGKPVLVIGVEEADDAEQTTLLVVRKL